MENNDARQDLQEAPEPEFTSMGRFGWTSIVGFHIPYLFRSREKYCAIRMAGIQTSEPWIKWVCQDRYSCVNIASYYVNENEARLLNEIAFDHCDSQYGTQRFNTEDLLVRLADLLEFYNFSSYCYSLLAFQAQTGLIKRCGFIRFSNDVVMPYLIKNSQRYIPMSRFDASYLFFRTPDIEKRGEMLEEGWDLSYLRFCYKVLGRRSHLFDRDFGFVVCLNDIKDFFYPGTTFEEYWPQEGTVEVLSRATQNALWVRKPTPTSSRANYGTSIPAGPPMFPPGSSLSRIVAEMKPAAPSPAPKPNIQTIALTTPNSTAGPSRSTIIRIGT